MPNFNITVLISGRPGDGWTVRLAIGDLFQRGEFKTLGEVWEWLTEWMQPEIRSGD